MDVWCWSNVPLREYKGVQERGRTRIKLRKNKDGWGGGGGGRLIASSRVAVGPEKVSLLEPVETLNRL